jgi:hypothetical protein
MRESDDDRLAYLRKAAEYRDRAAATRELLLRHALTAVANEYLRRANACTAAPADSDGSAAGEA